MKRSGMIYFMAMSIGLLTITGVSAQDSSTIGDDLKDAAKKTGRAVKKGAKKVGNKSAELASKGKSAVIDKVYEGKEGPDGQTIYINKRSEYYWVDEKGRRNYVATSQLRDKN